MAGAAASVCAGSCKVFRQGFTSLMMVNEVTLRWDIFQERHRMALSTLFVVDLLRRAVALQAHYWFCALL
jgi:hypothetical protein